MPQTLVSCYVHVIYSTKRREPHITPELAPRLHAYLGGIVRNEKAVQLACNGAADHVHQLLSLNANTALSDLMRTIKTNSSKWLHELDPKYSTFAWRDGYAAFSVSPSNLDAVREYLAKQEEHHKRVTFKQELIAFLEKHQIEYDPKYVFD